MTTCFDQARVELDTHLFLRMADAAGTTIVCLEGSLWITRDGQPDDIELAAGHSFKVPDAVRVIVTGFEPSLVRVMRPAAKPLPAARRTLRAWTASPDRDWGLVVV